MDKTKLRASHNGNGTWRISAQTLSVSDGCKPNNITGYRRFSPENYLSSSGAEAEIYRLIKEHPDKYEEG